MNLYRIEHIWMNGDDGWGEYNLLVCAENAEQASEIVYFDNRVNKRCIESEWMELIELDRPRIVACDTYLTDAELEEKRRSRY